MAMHQYIENIFFFRNNVMCLYEQRSVFTNRQIYNFQFFIVELKMFQYLISIPTCTLLKNPCLKIWICRGHILEQAILRDWTYVTNSILYY